MEKENKTINLQKADFTLKARSHSAATSRNEIPETEQKKSSYICPLQLQNSLKILAVNRGVSLNALLIEAIQDVLDKYSR